MTYDEVRFQRFAFASFDTGTSFRNVVDVVVENNVYTAFTETSLERFAELCWVCFVEKQIISLNDGNILVLEKGQHLRTAESV